MESGFEIFARLCCSDSKDQISSVPLERLIFEAPNRKMQLLFGQLGAVSLIGSLIQTLQFVWKVRVACDVSVWLYLTSSCRVRKIHQAMLYLTQLTFRKFWKILFTLH